MTEKGVSVIIPTHNRSRLLVKAVESVQRQTYRDFEIIIVDDASEDDTKEIVKGLLNDQVKYIRLDTNHGGSGARNIGINAAKGKYVAFLDDDDFWLPEKLERQVEVMKRSPQVGVVYTEWLQLENGRTYTYKMKPKYRGNIYKHLLAGNCVPGGGSTVLARRECFQSVGGFDEQLPSCQDWDMWIRLAREYEFDFVALPLIVWRMHNARISTDIDAVMRGRELLVRKILNEDRPGRKIRGCLLSRTGHLYCSLGDPRAGRKELLKGLRAYPLYPKAWAYFTASLLGHSLYTRITETKRSLISNRETDAVT